MPAASPRRHRPGRSAAPSTPDLAAHPPVDAEDRAREFGSPRADQSGEPEDLSRRRSQDRRQPADRPSSRCRADLQNRRAFCCGSWQAGRGPDRARSSATSSRSRLMTPRSSSPAVRPSRKTTTRSAQASTSRQAMADEEDRRHPGRAALASWLCRRTDSDSRQARRRLVEDQQPCVASTERGQISSSCWSASDSAATGSAGPKRAPRWPAPAERGRHRGSGRARRTDRAEFPGPEGRCRRHRGSETS